MYRVDEQTGATGSYESRHLQEVSWMIKCKTDYLREFIKHPEYGGIRGDCVRLRIENDVSSLSRP